MAAVCECRCHNWLRGTHYATYHAEHYMTAFQWAQRAKIWDELKGGVDASDVLEAALACRLCLDLHTPALSGRPMSPRIVKRWLGQSDGWVDPPQSEDAT